MTADDAPFPRISTAVRGFRRSKPEWSAWLDTLPTLVPEFVARWGLTDVRQDLPSDMNLLLRATIAATGERVVAKFQPPDFENEASTAALEVPIQGLVRLLDQERTAGVQLLAWVDGTPLPDAMDDLSLGRVVGAATKRLGALPPREGMIDLRRWCRELLEPPFNHPDWTDLIGENRARCLDLLASAPRDAWVHGDLHHGNLLVRPDGSTTAIDPKGLHGDPAFDTCTFVRNRIDLDLPEAELAERLRRRIDGFAEGSGLEFARCAAWAAAGNVLSEIWDAELDGGAGRGARIGYLRQLSRIARDAGV
ncbi:MAG: aminoglycoside phosphotransferase family protein [Armatimonadota bacterium]